VLSREIDRRSSLFIGGANCFPASDLKVARRGAEEAPNEANASRNESLKETPRTFRERERETDRDCIVEYDSVFLLCSWIVLDV